MLLNDIEEIAGDTVTLTPGDVKAEFSNTHWLSAGAEELSTLSVGQVVAAFQRTARTLQQRLGAAGPARTATFYVWHDDQAGQLRCSVSSRSRDNLPFGGRYRRTDELGAIVAGFLSDATPGLVAWEDLGPADAVDAPDSSCPPFPVWTFDLTAGH
ncbi:hypothetical protein [Dactylosporangium sp. NPDC005555]|uniref:hypothetical protein n=1 Tax=Dactylosporangium sp. NPDC005555 TaxID=3154889 RepID=UPI0033A485BD